MRRLVLTAILMFTGAWLIFRLCYLPYRCNQTIGVAVSAIQRDVLGADNIATAISARGYATQLEMCLRSGTQLSGSHLLVSCYMAAAANLRTLKRFDEALLMYRHALRLDRRPELYLQIGNTLEELGNHREALRYYMLAVTFNPQFIYDRSVLPPLAWNEIYVRFVEDETRLRKRSVDRPSMPIE